VQVENSHQILVQLRVTTVHLDNIKRNLNNRLVKPAQMDMLNLQQPVARFVSRDSIKTQSLSVKNVLLATSNQLQGRWNVMNVPQELLQDLQVTGNGRAKTVPKDISKKIQVKQAVQSVLA
tara:strand:- start:177 stop:539 length:363 start_codon:yes stop_codon:yes gene_type:complete